MESPLTRRHLLKRILKAGISFTVIPPIHISQGILNFIPLKDRPMIERTIPATGEKIPAIGMGTWQTFDVGNNKEKKANLEQVLKMFKERGGKFIDSSPMYGSSEAVVGELSKKLGLQESLFLASKVWTSGKNEGTDQIEKTMRLMKAQKIDLMQVHNLVDYKTHLQTLRRMKDEGKVRYIGITHYTTSSYPDLMKVIKEHPLDFVQFNYSIQTRQAENSILPFAAENGIAVVINRPFEGGSMFSKVKGLEVPSWAETFNCKSWGNFFLKYIISHPAVTCAIPATDNLKHLHDNMEALYGNLPDEQTRLKMAKFFDGL
ncbi:MAG: aldo/keto reductase [Bacteroidota bacterium]|nr:aldo/keto reductase [Bacteroidota bacterium]